MVQNDIYGAEVRVLGLLSQLTEIAPEASSVVIGYPWFSDEIADYKSEVLGFLFQIAKLDEALGVEIASTPLIAGGIPKRVVWNIDIISDVFEDQGSLADQIIRLSWVRDGLTVAGLEALESLSRMGYPDAFLARQVVELSWVKDWGYGNRAGGSGNP